MTDMTSRPKPPVPGPGALQWSTGGWFGAQIGGTLWILILASVLVAGSVPLALVALAAFVASNLVGLLLWTRRDRLEPYPAMMILVLGMAVGGAAAAIAFHLATRQGIVPASLRTSPVALYAALLVYPAVAWTLHRRDRARRPR